MIPFDRTRLNSGWRQFQVMVSETTPTSVGRYAKAVIHLAGVEELFPPPTVLWFSNRIENAAHRACEPDASFSNAITKIGILFSTQRELRRYAHLQRLSSVPRIVKSNRYLVRARHRGEHHKPKCRPKAV
jgi:hypothetical protein